MLRSWFNLLDSRGQRYHPTIKPTKGFSASADAEYLRKAIRGAGTDEKTLINTLARRTNYERQEIVKAYAALHNRDLIADVKSDTSGQFRTVLCELLHDTSYMLAKSLYYATKGVGTNERVLIEILITLWNDELKAVEQAYKKVLEDKGIENEKRNLKDDVSSDTSGDFQHALLNLCQGQRDDIPPIQLKAIPEKGVSTVQNEELAEKDAKELLAAGASRVGTNSHRITRIICNRTPFQLQAAMSSYEKLFGKTLQDDIVSETSGDYRDLLISILRYTTNRPELIADWIHNAVSGLGTKDYTLTRLLITRAEIDLEDVKTAYMEKYQRTLEDVINGDTSGDYNKTLLALIKS